MSARGWWAISGDAFIEALRRAHDGEDPEMVYAEWYANSDVESAGTPPAPNPANPSINPKENPMCDPTNPECRCADCVHAGSDETDRD